MEQQKGQDAPPKCAGGCGFFGNPLTSNYCSKCFRDYQKKQTPSSTSSSTSISTPQPMDISSTSPTTTTPSIPQAITPSVENTSTTSNTSTTTPSLPKQVDPMKCYSCSRKVGLLGFKCRCEFIFCSHHRHSEQHNCTFDYKADAKVKLEKLNPQVVKAKLDKI